MGRCTLVTTRKGRLNAFMFPIYSTFLSVSKTITFSCLASLSWVLTAPPRGLEDFRRVGYAVFFCGFYIIFNCSTFLVYLFCIFACFWIGIVIFLLMEMFWALVECLALASHCKSYWKTAAYTWFMRLYHNVRLKQRTPSYFCETTSISFLPKFKLWCLNREKNINIHQSSTMFCEIKPLYTCFPPFQPVGPHGLMGAKSWDVSAPLLPFYTGPLEPPGPWFPCLCWD